MASEKAPRSILQADDPTPELPDGCDRRAFMIASNEIPSSRRVDFDTTVSAMALTAKEMNAKYKETSEGGLAVSLVRC